MQPRESLRRRIVVAFVSFGLVLSLFFAVLAAVAVTALLSITLFALTHVVQRLLIPWYGKDRRARG